MALLRVDSFAPSTPSKKSDTQADAVAPTRTETIAEPVAFAGQFGWLHRPARGLERPPVILCGALGVEMMCAHRAWRRLAEMFAESGYPTLRFDYRGAGDSIGEPDDPDRVEDWRRGIADAIDWMKGGDGAARVTLVGLRFGALLAADIAATRDDIAALALLAPVVIGRAYARELTALSGLTSPIASSQISEPLNVGGFSFTNDLLADMRARDIRRFARPQTRTLILARGGDAEGDLAQGWREAGVDVATATFEGYDAFMSSPTTTLPPLAAWDRVIAWRRAEEAHVERPAPSVLRLTSPIAGQDWRETPLQFGRDNRLFGVLTRPTKKIAANDVAIVILNAGRNHHVGWGRGAVEWSRRFARDGFTVLRMDAAGVGDSPAWPEGPKEVLYAPEQRADLAAALDRLGAEGFRRFVLVGACAGAYLALHGARDDQRVVGFALINLLRFHWSDRDDLEQAMAQQVYRPTGSYASRLANPDVWRRALRGEIAITSIAAALARRIIKTIADRGAVALARLGLGSSRTDEAASWFREFELRGVSMRLIYAEEDPGLAELGAYFGPQGARLAKNDRLPIEMIPDADHNLSTYAARDQAAAIISGLLCSIETRS